MLNISETIQDRHTITTDYEQKVVRSLPSPISSSDL